MELKKDLIPCLQPNTGSEITLKARHPESRSNTRMKKTECHNIVIPQLERNTKEVPYNNNIIIKQSTLSEFPVCLGLNQLQYYVYMKRSSTRKLLLS